MAAATVKGTTWVRATPFPAPLHGRATPWGEPPPPVPAPSGHSPPPAPPPYLSGKKGLSDSALPYKRTAPSWSKATPASLEEDGAWVVAADCGARPPPPLPASPRSPPTPHPVCKYAKKGLTPSQIGIVLRDSHGIAQVKSVTGTKILRLLKKKGLAPALPEDLYHLIKRAVAVRKHLERNRADFDSKFRLILIESRIHRVARYYKTARALPPTWRYESATASTLGA